MGVAHAVNVAERESLAPVCLKRVFTEWSRDFIPARDMYAEENRLDTWHTICTNLQKSSSGALPTLICLQKSRLK